MKKIIILCLAVFSAQCINAMEQQPKEKEITLLLADNQGMAMPESEMPFFSTIANVAQDRSDDAEIPLKCVSKAAMTLLRKEVPWALAVHKKKKADITAQEIGSMSVREREAIARDAAKTVSAESSYDIAVLKGYIEAGYAAEYLGAYELRQKCAGSIAASLKSDAYLNVLRKQSPIEKYSPSSAGSSSDSGWYKKIADLFKSRDIEVRPVFKNMCPEDINIISTVRESFSSHISHYMCDDLLVSVHSFSLSPKTVAVSEDGKNVIFSMEKYGKGVQIVRFSDKKNKWETTEKVAHDGNAAFLAMSSDGKTMVTFSGQQTQINQWNESENEWEQEWKIDLDVHQASISADGNTAIIASNAETHIVKRSNASNKWLPTYKAGHGHKPSSALISEDGSTAVIAYKQTTQILKWHDEEKQWTRSLDVDTAKEGPVAVSADGNTVMAEFGDGRKIVRWSAQEKRWVASHTVENHDIALAKMSANGNTVVTLSKDEKLQLTRCDSQSGLWLTQEVGGKITGEVALDVSADGDTVLVTWPMDREWKWYVSQMSWNTDDQEWYVSTIDKEITGRSLNKRTNVARNGNLYELISLDTWEKKILEKFLEWAQKNGKPVTASAWVRQIFETCDTQQQRLLTKQYGNLLRVLTESATEKFE
jgi:hypothetical protein